MKKKKKPPAKADRLTLKIELEDDAEDLFQQAVENFSTTKWKLEKKDKKTVPPQASRREKGSKQLQEIDLHGLTLEEAKDAVTNFIQSVQAFDSSQKTLKIITGKGRRSGKKGGVLSREIHSFVVKKFQNIILDIESAPADTEISDGVLWRGHFHVTIRS